MGRLSGNGWAIGYAGGLVSLVITLGLLAGDPSTGKTLLGVTPLFGLDPALREGDRAAGPLSALWFVLFVLPLFLFTPDVPKRLAAGAAVRKGLATLADTLRTLPRHRSTALFLAANMIYADGLVALFAFGGIYAAGTFGWGTIQIGVFGILLTITGTIGAFVGGKLDDRFGPRPVILGSLGLLIFASIAILSIGRDTVGFVIPVAPPVPGGGLYASTAERAYVAIGLLIGIAAGPLQAASRTLLVRIAPRDRVTQFFGLLALSGKVTSFMGPLLVATVTTAFAQPEGRHGGADRFSSRRACAAAGCEVTACNAPESSARLRSLQPLAAFGEERAFRCGRPGKRCDDASRLDASLVPALAGTSGIAHSCMYRLMPEMPHAGEHHGDAGVVGGLDHLVVAHRAAGLDDGGGAGLDRHQQTVGERKERVRRDHRALRQRLGEAQFLGGVLAPCARRCARSRCGSSGRRRCRRWRDPWRTRWCSTSRAWRRGRRTADRQARRWSAPAWSRP